jgi:hypothetical protein
MAWVVKLTIGIERLSISIYGLNTTYIKWDKNIFGVVLKFAGLCRDFHSPK